jgi:hypothetical protein
VFLTSNGGNGRRLAQHCQGQGTGGDISNWRNACPEARKKMFEEFQGISVAVGHHVHLLVICDMNQQNSSLIRTGTCLLIQAVD